MTVLGPLKSTEAGFTLIHEHILVDFIGADKISSDRWEHEAVIQKVLPFLLAVKERGVKTLVECTPAFLGRDVELLKKLSKSSGVQLMTNTGYYGAVENKYLPAYAYSESAEMLSKRWISEFENGIDGTGIKPGFIKIGVDPGRLSALHRKLVRAAALTHLGTGLTICADTGPAATAEEELDLLEAEGVSPEAFVWVHASGDEASFIRLGKRGCWISLDGISSSSLTKNLETVVMLKANGLLKKVLISHDAGWYRPQEPDGGEFRGFTEVPDLFLPLLAKNGFDRQDIHQIMVRNPAEAFTIRLRTR